MTVDDRFAGRADRFDEHYTESRGRVCRMRRRENAQHLVFKLAQRLEHSWCPLNGGLTIMTLLLGGARSVDGVCVPTAEEVSAA